MKRSKRFTIHLLVALVALAVCATAFASAKQQKPKPRKDVLKQFNLKEDPGTDPDETKVFERDGGRFTIVKIPSIDTRPPTTMGDGWIRHMHLQAQDLEVYQEDENYVWVWFPYQDPYVPDIRHAVDESGRQVEIRTMSPDGIELYKLFRKEFEVVTPAPAKRTVVFRESSEGLPTAGSWRNAADSGDMNGDGFVDLILPPQRGMPTTPSIFLGDGKGGWSQWEDVSFPFQTNYGSVSVGDLNGDGHLDIAQAVHLKGPVVYLGDGKGNFVDASEGLPSDFPTRRLRLADVNGNGHLDIVALDEGPVRGGGGSGGVKVRAFLNDGSGSKWTPVDVNVPELTMGGDWMDVGDLNGDGLPDIVTSSIYHGGRALIHFSSGAAKWEAYGGGFPFSSYYFALATGKFSGTGRDEAVMSFQRHWRYEVDPEIVPPPRSGRLSGIERVAWNTDGTVTRTPVVQWLGELQHLRALGAGDFDGDGHLDIVYVDSELLELAVLLGDGEGGFTQAAVEGVTLPDSAIYDIHVTDVNGDGRPDLVLLFEASEGKKDGSVRVWLGMGQKGDGGA